MGVYALVLLGSNYFAPLISGFINDGQGWQWVLVSWAHYQNRRFYLIIDQYWCAIFNGVALVILFFFMEETNYYRAPLLSVELEQQVTVEEISGSRALTENPSDLEKGPRHDDSTASSTRGATTTYEPKSFFQKLKLFRDEDLKKENQLVGMVVRPLKFTTFPVIFFSGFMYGSILCYFNVMNGTASIIFSAAPYNFSSSMVGLTYVACLIGTAVG
jgi:hypothetical protein